MVAFLLFVLFVYSFVFLLVVCVCVRICCCSHGDGHCHGHCHVDGVGGMEDQHHGQEDLVWNVWCGIDIDLNGGCCMLP